MIIEVKLFTEQGEYVTTVLVPPFPEDHKPNVILWGDRPFLRSDTGQYVECFMVAAWTESQWIEMKTRGNERN